MEDNDTGIKENSKEENKQESNEENSEEHKEENKEEEKERDDYCNCLQLRDLTLFQIKWSTIKHRNSQADLVIKFTILDQNQLSLFNNTG